MTILVKVLVHTGAIAIMIALPHWIKAEESNVQTLNYSDTQHKQINETSIRRKQWLLSDEEWSRYQELMHGIRGSISPATISPIEVLGTHARTDQEREKYAEIWARMRHEDAERILAFQQAYSEAFQKLYPNESLIDFKRLKRNRQTKPTIAKGDRILVFIKIKHCPDCDNLIQRLTHNPTLKANQMDLYFVDTQPKKDDARIRQWAQAQGIDSQRLKNGTITLNHNNGNYYKLTQQLVGPIPQVFKMTGQTVVAIHL